MNLCITLNTSKSILSLFRKFISMMTSSNGNIFRGTGHSCGVFTRWIPRTKEFPVNSPHKGQWRGALMFALICAWINDWVNNREAGDLIRYRAHYDVIVMSIYMIIRILLMSSSNRNINHELSFRLGYALNVFLCSLNICNLAIHDNIIYQSAACTNGSNPNKNAAWF